MKFLNPAGLWLLLGIPVLIIIYLIRPRHEERPVSSTFMWKLSQKFMKKKLPLQRLRRFFLFLLQLLLIAGAALLIARPARVTGKTTEYIAIIDASASMQTKDENGVSRFDRAVEEAKNLTEHLADGHRLSIIVASDNAQCLIQSAKDADRVKLALERAQCGNGGCNTEKAFLLAQQLCNSGKSEVLFYTDAPAEQTSNIKLVNMNKGEWNLSIDTAKVTTDDDGGEYITANITSHNSPVSTTVGVRIDGALSSAKKVNLPANEQVEVSILVDNLELGSMVEVYVDEQDGLALDNSYFYCTGYSRMYNVLIVSANPFYLEKALMSLENCSIAVTDDPSVVQFGGFDLYVFDGLYPKEYPIDGSVLQFGVEMLPDGLEALEPAELPAKAQKLSKGHDFYENLSMLDTTVGSYTPLAVSAQWEKVLTCAGKPVCVTNLSESGTRTTVFSFDLHNSNLPMQTDYMVLMKNIVDASVFDLISDTSYAIGSTIEISVLPMAQEMYLSLPDGKIRPLTPEKGRCSVTLDQIGVHSAVVETAYGGEFGDFFVHIPDGETMDMPHGVLSIVPATDISASPDAIAELWMWVAAAMLVLLILEWGVYFREQY